MLAGQINGAVEVNGNWTEFVIVFGLPEPKRTEE